MKNEYELMDELALTLGISAPESEEERNGSELYKRKVLRRANEVIKNKNDLDANSVLDSMKYEEWLKTSCFKEPTKEAKELAKMAWNAAVFAAIKAVEIEYNMLGDAYTSTDMFEGAQKAIADIIDDQR